MSLLLGDCIGQMKTLPDNSVDAVVCDPPYELGFMGKSWDASGIAYSVEMWKEVLRVTKPGGHLLAFGGTRTYHRMACAIEDAGFEIRDQLQWLYGSGFPKSYNIGKGVDKLQGNKREEFVDYDFLKRNPDSGQCEKGIINKGHFDGYFASIRSKGCSVWEGWGSGLKPMNEPICLARKPLSEKNLVENVLKWGVGGLNIDASRIGNENISTHNAPKGTFAGGEPNRGSDINSYKNHVGRFPGNVLLDEESAKMLDEQSGISKGGKRNNFVIRKENSTSFGGKAGQVFTRKEHDDVGGASRFFYVAKASKSERNFGLDGFVEKNVSHDGRNKFIENPYQRHENIQSNHHPTVKPVKLMEYLVRLVTPKGGIVLDPFMGSGTTGIACRNLGFGFIGIEKEKEYFDIAKARIGNQSKSDKK